MTVAELIEQLQGYDSPDKEVYLCCPDPTQCKPNKTIEVDRVSSQPSRDDKDGWIVVIECR